MKSTNIFQNKRRQYNAVFRLRRKGISVSTPAKTIYGQSYLAEHRTLKLLMKDFHFVLQTELFQ